MSARSSRRNSSLAHSALWSRVGAAMLMLVPLGGCSGGQQEAPRNPSNYIQGAVALPFDPFIFDVEASAIWLDLLATEVTACMAAHGVQYSPPETMAPQPPPLYGVASLEEAAVAGYRPATVEDEGASIASDAPEGTIEELLYGTTANAVSVDDLDGNTLVVYDPGSCIAKSTIAVQPDWIEILRLESALQEHVIASRTAAENRSSVRAGWAEWSACMGARGFEFSDPWATFHSVWPGSTPGEGEIATAIADVECKNETGLLSTWSEAIADAQDQLLTLDNVSRDWERWLNLRTNWLER